MVARHAEERAAATIAAVEREDASRFGRMVVDGGRLASFEEKRPERAPGLVNAGVYVLERRVVEGVAAGRAVSFEREVLPGLLAADAKVAVHVHGGYFEDIGVPETLAAFRAREAARRAAARAAEVARIRGELEESVAVKRAWSDELCAGIAAAAERVVAALRAGGKVVFLGNGGSAADAQHLAAEFVGKFGRERAPLRAMALHVNTSAVTAIANDWEYDYVFERQVEAWVDARDVVVGLSTSGNSGGVVRALEKARALGAFAVALTGEGGGRCAAACDLLLAIPSRSTPRIQESHITAGHVLCGLVEAALADGA
jgi:D-sedoheptulose 7-phosphate isomerase